MFSSPQTVRGPSAFETSSQSCDSLSAPLQRVLLSYARAPQNPCLSGRFTGAVDKRKYPTPAISKAALSIPSTCLDFPRTTTPPGPDKPNAILLTVCPKRRPRPTIWHVKDDSYGGLMVTDHMMTVNVWVMVWDGMVPSPIPAEFTLNFYFFKATCSPTPY
jgi:hypothetical protein